jgi:DNA-binding LytR/AlgR family response regulator
MYSNYEKQNVKGNSSGQKEQLRLKNIIVLRGKENLIIPVMNILYFFYEDKNVFVVTKENEIYIYEKRLSFIEKVLCSCFFRINRQVIINYYSILSYYYIKNDKIQLVVKHGQGRNMVVGKNKVADFKKWIMFRCPCCTPECMFDF